MGLAVLEHREGLQRAGTHERRFHSADAGALDAWRMDQAEQGLGPLRRRA